jgi:hypothetical protein
VYVPRPLQDFLVSQDLEEYPGGIGEDDFESGSPYKRKEVVHERAGYLDEVPGNSEALFEVLSVESGLRRMEGIDTEIPATLPGFGNFGPDNLHIYSIMFKVLAPCFPSRATGTRLEDGIDQRLSDFE